MLNGPDIKKPWFFIDFEGSPPGVFGSLCNAF
jgi:hypothetical protein